MNKLESIIYNVVRKNPALKQLLRNLYQSVFDLLPRQKEYFAGDFQMQEHYFFGFHDITPFSVDETKVLANHTLFDLSMPKPEQFLEVGYFDFYEGKMGTFHLIDKSFAWNYHKGCRLQWLDQNHLIFNTAENSKPVSKIININSFEERIIDFPIDATYVNSDCWLATSFSYERLERCMPGYGYPYQDDGYIEQSAPSETGLFIIDLNKNTQQLLIPISDLIKTIDPSFYHGYLHFVTHSEFSHDGRYISFLHRWISKTGDYMKRWTRIMVYDRETKELIELPSQNSGSHYVWNRKNQLLASCIIDGRSCHVLFDINNINKYQVIAKDRLNSDGHQSFISNTTFVTDTYPDKYRMAKIYEVNSNTSDTKMLLNVFSPKKFQTKDFKCHIACDLHPRISPLGKYICFDSSRTGKRALYIMNL